MESLLEASRVSFNVIGYCQGMSYRRVDGCSSLSVATTNNEWKALCTNQMFPCDDIAKIVDFSRNNLFILSSRTAYCAHVLGIKCVRKIGEDILQIQYGEVDYNPGTCRATTSGLSSVFFVVSKAASYKQIHIDQLSLIQPGYTDPYLRSYKKYSDKYHIEYYRYKAKMFAFLELEDFKSLEYAKSIQDLRLSMYVDLDKVKRIFVKFLSAKSAYQKYLEYYDKIRKIHYVQLCGSRIFGSDG